MPTKTKAKETEADTAIVKKDDRAVAYVPLGENTSIELTIGAVQQMLAVKTRNGHMPNDADTIKFMMLCKARELNPWVGDAYLIGYDSKDGPSFSLITSHQALAKRSERSPEFDGIRAGVIVKVQGGGDVPDGAVEYREGDIVFSGEQLMGGWAKVYRKDCSHPFYQALDVKSFDGGHGRWNKDKAGMIVKCAEAAAFRMAFPTQLGGMYTTEEQHAITSAPEMAPMPEGKQAFGFKGQTNGEPEQTVPPPVEQTQPEPEEIEQQEKPAPEPEPAAPEPVEKPAVETEAKPEPAAEPSNDVTDQRWAQLVDLCAMADSCELDEAEPKVKEWLSKLGYKREVLAEDQRWEKIILARAQKKWNVPI